MFTLRNVVLVLLYYSHLLWLPLWNYHLLLWHLRYRLWGILEWVHWNLRGLLVSGWLWYKCRLIYIVTSVVLLLLQIHWCLKMPWRLLSLDYGCHLLSDRLGELRLLNMHKLLMRMLLHLLVLLVLKLCNLRGLNLQLFYTLYDLNSVQPDLYTEITL